MSIYHHVSKMLEDNDYVHCLSIDFSKAFDTVNHAILLEKLSRLPLHPAVVAVISSFLFGRTQATKIGKEVSSALSISRSIVQGSGLGPYLYIIYKSDLKTISNENALLMYADDANLLIPQKSNSSIIDEFDNIQSWAERNKMIINLKKTKQLVFRRPNLSASLLPSYIPDVDVVDTIKLLGVYVNAIFRQSEHVGYILSICNQRLYLLKVLRALGLDRRGLDCVFHAIIVSRLIYAIEAWGNFVNKEQEGKINKTLKKANKWGLSTYLYTFSILQKRYAENLFYKVCANTEHCLFHLLPLLAQHNYNLRRRRHEHQIIRALTSLHRKSYIVDCLIKGDYAT